MASVYGYHGPTLAQRRELNSIVEHILGEFRARGRGPCLLGGDLNVEPGGLDVHEVLGRAGWVDWSSEPTCRTANSQRIRRIDQCWISGEMQTRLSGPVLVDWFSGLCTHALQEGTFREGKPSSYVCWQLGDKGPAEKEKGFSDHEFWEALGGSSSSWEEAVAQGNVDTLWNLLEETLCRCHGLRSPGFQAPAARTVPKQEEPKRNLHEGYL